MSQNSTVDPFPAGADVPTLIAQAQERGKQASVPYRGLILPKEAWALVQAGAARIIDVRTRAEWEYVGRIPESVLIEWRAYGATEANPEFLKTLQHQAKPEENLLFLCRSGVRSHAAAALANANGFGAAFNILGGFEGDLDAQKHRNQTGGWRHAMLPWIQD